jgi:hypothetical protein
MMTAFRGWGLGCVIAGALVMAAPVSAQDSEGVVRLGNRSADGVIRISDRNSIEVVRGQSHESDSGSPANIAQTTHCEVDHGLAGSGSEVIYSSDCPPGDFEECRGCRKHHKWYSKWLGWHDDSHGDWFNGKCKNHGPARPLAGKYHIVYPVDPSYFDQRDGQVYAAPGYGGPVSVPLAPVVHHTYNYGWGIPSSRLTPVLHPATRAPISQYPSPYPTAPIAR